MTTSTFSEQSSPKLQLALNTLESKKSNVSAASPTKQQDYFLTENFDEESEKNNFSNNLNHYVTCINSMLKRMN